MIFYIKYERLYKTVTETIAGNYDGDGFAFPRGDKTYSERVNDGTSITLRRINQDVLEKKMAEGYETFKEARKAFFNKVVDLDLSIDIKAPEIHHSVEVVDEVVAEMEVENNLPEGGFFVRVHWGMRGWYLKEVSKVGKVTAVPHRRVDRYGYSVEGFEIPIKDGEERLDILGDAEELLLEHLGKEEFDERYSFL